MSSVARSRLSGMTTDWNCASAFPWLTDAALIPALLAGEPTGEHDSSLGADGPRLGPGEQLRVVIIEDELFAAWMIEGLLEELGHQVVAIHSSGEQALAAGLHGADLAIVDINLGAGIDGIAAAAELRRTSSAALIFCTAYSDQATRTRAAAAVPTAPMIGKPVSDTDLKLAIEAALQSRH